MDNKDNRELFEDINIPDRLSPDNIEKLLEENKNKHTAINVTEPLQKPVENKPSKIKVATRVVSALVACGVLVFGITSLLNRNKPQYFNGEGYSFKTDISMPQDYGEVYKTIQRVNSVSDTKKNTIADFFKGLFYNGKGDDKDAATNDGIADGEVTEPQDESDDYSGTHQQVEGVEEADLLKSDGKYIYYIAKGSLNIVSAENGKLTYLSHTEKSDDTIVEMYLVNNRIILIRKKLDNTYPREENRIKGYNDEQTEEYRPDNADTFVDIIDITDKANPEVVNSYSQNGNYISSRMIDNCLYLATSYTVEGSVKKENEEGYIPSYNMNNKQSLIEAKDINIALDCNNTTYTILAGIDTSAQKPLVSIKAVLGYSGVVYANSSSFYVAGPKFGHTSQKTAIIRFSMNNGQIEHNGYGEVDGIVLNQFSMDEHNGYFRIATTDFNYSSGKRSNGIYVLDDKLKTVGKKTGIAPQESIKSARFDGDTAYIVTFLNTDPLYRIDLSDPKKPEIKSETKINGYSAYLVSFGDGKLLGIGVNADENGITDGMKITMFSKGDNGSSEEISSEVLGSGSVLSDLYDHKKYIAEPEKNIIGIPVSYYDGIDFSNEYYLYRFNNDKFEQIGKYEQHTSDYGNYFVRSMYIGDYVYLFSKEAVSSFDIEKFEKQDTLAFK